MSRFLNSAHQASMNCCTASVVVRETKSDFGVNCSDSKCTLVSPCALRGALSSTSDRSAINRSTSRNFWSICGSSKLESMVRGWPVSRAFKDLPSAAFDSFSWLANSSAVGGGLLTVKE